MRSRCLLLASQPVSQPIRVSQLTDFGRKSRHQQRRTLLLTRSKRFRFVIKQRLGVSLGGGRPQKKRLFTCLRTTDWCDVFPKKSAPAVIYVLMLSRPVATVTAVIRFPYCFGILDMDLMFDDFCNIQA